MPTSSITHNFIVTNPEKFLQAVEESGQDKLEQYPTPKKKLSYKLLTNPKEIAEFMKKRELSCP